MAPLPMDQTSCGFRFGRAWGIAALACVILAGCANSNSSLSREQAANRDSDAEFENGANQPPNAKTMYAMAKILINQGRDRDALNMLIRLVQQYPAYLPAYNEMAGIYAHSDRLGDAIRVLNDGLKQSPKSAILQNNLGMCWFLKKDYAKALECFNQAVLALPDDRTYKANQAVALGMLGRDKEAADSYRGVVSPETTQANLEVLRKAREIDSPTRALRSPKPNDDAPRVRPSNPSRPEVDETSETGTRKAPTAPFLSRRFNTFRIAPAGLRNRRTPPPARKQKQR